VGNCFDIKVFVNIGLIHLCTDMQTNTREYSESQKYTDNDTIMSACYW